MPKADSKNERAYETTLSESVADLLPKFLSDAHAGSALKLLSSISERLSHDVMRCKLVGYTFPSERELSDCLEEINGLRLSLDSLSIPSEAKSTPSIYLIARSAMDIEIFEAIETVKNRIGLERISWKNDVPSKQEIAAHIHRQIPVLNYSDPLGKFLDTVETSNAALETRKVIEKQQEWLTSLAVPFLIDFLELYNFNGLVDIYKQKAPVQHLFLNTSILTICDAAMESSNEAHKSINKIYSYLGVELGLSKRISNSRTRHKSLYKMYFTANPFEALKLIKRINSMISIH